MHPLFLVIATACNSDKPSTAPTQPTETTETAETTETTETTEPTEPTKPTKPTEPKKEPASPWGLLRCPEPPADALTFAAGTHHVDRVFVREGSVYFAFDSGVQLVATRVSYVHETSCKEERDGWEFSYTGDNEILHMTDPIKLGWLVGDFMFRVVFTAPTTVAAELLGASLDNGGHLANDKFPAHQMMLGWHDGEAFRQVYSLPDGMTRSTVCFDQFSRTHMVMTGLFEPLDGPYTTNKHTTLTQPIWFKLEAWATDTGPDEDARHRSCMLNAVSGGDEETAEAWLGEVFAE